MKYWLFDRAVKVPIDGNGNAVFEVALCDMSFAWFTVRSDD